MAAFRGGGTGGMLAATGAGNAKVYAGPGSSGLWLSSLSPGFVNNNGPTSITPPPGTGTAPGGAGIALVESSGGGSGTGGGPGTGGGGGGTSCGSGDNGPGCLTSEERVMLYNGECKLAGAIELGDLLLTIDPQGVESCEKVINVFALKQPLVRVIHEQGEFTCSTSHRMVTPDGKDLSIIEFATGEHLVSGIGQLVKILAILEGGEGQVFGWTCEPLHTFVASGLLHHNKWYPWENVPRSQV